MTRSGPTNVSTRLTIAKLRKLSASSPTGSGTWKAASRLLSVPSRTRATVNLSKISRYSGAAKFVLVPGKVLGSGSLSRPVIIACQSVSATAKRKITSAGGEAISIGELVRRVQDTSGIVIVK